MIRRAPRFLAALLALSLPLLATPAPAPAAPSVDSVLRWCLGSHYDRLLDSRRFKEAESKVREARAALAANNGHGVRNSYIEALAEAEDAWVRLRNESAASRGEYQVIPNRHPGEELPLSSDDARSAPHLGPREFHGVHYFNDAETRAHRIEFVNGKFVDSTGAPLDTAAASIPHGSRIPRALIVMDERGRFYVTMKHEVGRIHHSTLLGGRPVAFAGEAVFEDGVLKVLNDHSGHYRPPRILTAQALEQLGKLGVDPRSIQLEFQAAAAPGRGERARLKALGIGAPSSVSTH